jgi:AbrB family looped-hinge helix DNA binding protein
MAKSNLLEIKSAKITEKGQIAIPKQLRDAGGFGEGSKVAILVYKDRMELRPMGSLSDAMSAFLTSQKSLAKNWLAPEEDRAWKHL